MFYFENKNIFYYLLVDSVLFPAFISLQFATKTTTQIKCYSIINQIFLISMPKVFIFGINSVTIFSFHNKKLTCHHIFNEKYLAPMCGDHQIFFLVLNSILGTWNDLMNICSFIKIKTVSTILKFNYMHMHSYWKLAVYLNVLYIVSK